MTLIIAPWVRTLRLLVIPIFLLTVCFTRGQNQSPFGKWEGTVSAQGNLLPIQILIAKDGKKLKGFFVSSAQGFVSEIKATLDGPDLRVEADVPNGLLVEFSGEVTNSVWNPKFRQGIVTGQAKLKLDSPIELTTLAIRPSYQSQPMWCWITVGEMIFRHLEVLNDTDPPGHPSQCKIVRTIFEGNPMLSGCSLNCDQCGFLGGGTSREIAGMLSDFPRRELVKGRKVPRVFSSIAPPLSFTEIRRELEKSYPVVAGISPGAEFQIDSRTDPFFPSMHVALVVGALKTNKGSFLLVNDPFPFPMGPANPYLKNGAFPLISSNHGVPQSAAYFIREETFKNAMVWKESILARVEK